MDPALLKLNERKYQDRLSKMLMYRERGKLAKSVGLTYEGYLPGAAIGSIVKVLQSSSANVMGDESEIAFQNAIDAEVIGFKDKRVILMPLDDSQGISNSSKLVLTRAEATISVGPWLLGRVIDGKGEPIDGKGPLTPDLRHSETRSLYATSVNPLARAVIDEPLDLGVRAINGLLTCGKGQRMGIMAGSGVGKSVLLGMMARNTKANVNVIALIGERGREVNEFIERDLGPEGLKRSVIVVTTSDKSPLLKMRSAFIATTIAEYFCDQGLDVLMLMDSVTRFCMAQREIGLSMGEPPASKGYTPSVFSTLPKLLERAGRRSDKGSITGLYTVLVEGDDMDEPIADAARSILDGHIVLSRHLAARNHYPAIDVAQSVSRVMTSVVNKRHKHVAGELKELMAVYAANEDLISIGAYVKGANPKLDQAVAVIDRLKLFLRQNVEDRSDYGQAIGMMEGILSTAGMK